MDNFILFAGTANSDLAAAVAQKLNIPLGKSLVERFPDGELNVRLLESVRQKAVFILQSTAPPVNDHLVELLAFADACRRAAASRITAIIPYFGYARADKRHGRREPITASMVAEVLQAVGVNHVVTLDLHTLQIEGFFRIPVDSLTAVPIFCEAIRHYLPPNFVVVSPDTGRVQMATQYAQKLDNSVVVLHKHRTSGTETEVTRVVGDVKGCACLIIDDMISTGGTLAKSIEALLKAEARPEIIIAATHGLFVKEARAKLSHPSVKAIFVTDSVTPKETDWQQLKIVSIAPLIATTIQRFKTDGSISDLF
ncbi:ribose-phosphate pyrophosphokinase [Nostoc sp. FACHB-133]|uniref:ribose-phosphate diphosphokinase n=1 Tax=Nostoc sp. FACHB-133 TaxID=2692835 RepID=UPI001686E434|nr:ribose-phosphate pyrophosphokinase [Nostoc sp. FACHB-133]MBD2525803.1 ribose-phosphate pyrophosphokinase [Nostoc sp. FACHB-133]